MTLDENRTAMQCLIDTTTGAKPNCLNCTKKNLCDDFTKVIMKHKYTEKKKPAAEIQQDILRDNTKKYPAF